MEKRLEKMFCPVVSKEIDDEICCDVIHVAEEMHPERFAPEEFRKIPNYKEICNNCKNHPE